MTNVMMGLTPTFLSRSPTMLRAEMRVDGVKFCVPLKVVCRGVPSGVALVLMREDVGPMLPPADGLWPPGRDVVGGGTGSSEFSATGWGLFIPMGTFSFVVISERKSVLFCLEKAKKKCLSTSHR